MFYYFLFLCKYLFINLEVISLFNLIEGLEQLEAVKVDEDSNVFIFYTVTDEFMLENGLTYKHRVYKINLFGSEHPRFVSYAVAVEPDED